RRAIHAIISIAGGSGKKEDGADASLAHPPRLLRITSAAGLHGQRGCGIPAPPRDYPSPPIGQAACQCESGRETAKTAKIHTRARLSTPVEAGRFCRALPFGHSAAVRAQFAYLTEQP